MSKAAQAPEGDAMDLQTFVTETIRSVVEGIRGALDQGIHVAYASGYREIEFDVAVTATQSTARRAGAGILVGALGIGGQASSQATSSSISRIKFSVPVSFPGKPE
jgi:hypothetical protein